MGISKLQTQLLLSLEEDSNSETNNTRFYIGETVYWEQLESW